MVSMLQLELQSDSWPLVGLFTSASLFYSKSDESTRDRCKGREPGCGGVHLEWQQIILLGRSACEDCRGLGYYSVVDLCNIPALCNHQTLMSIQELSLYAGRRPCGCEGAPNLVAD